MSATVPVNVVVCCTKPGELEVTVGATVSTLTVIAAAEPVPPSLTGVAVTVFAPAASATTAVQPDDRADGSSSVAATTGPAPTWTLTRPRPLTLPKRTKPRIVAVV